VFDCPIADVFEFECIGAVSALIAHGSDQAGFAFPGQRENAQEIGLVEIDVQFAIERGASRFDIGDVEDLPVSASRKGCADRVAHS
jgi:hypothetical protein